MKKTKKKPPQMSLRLSSADQLAQQIQSNLSTALQHPSMSPQLLPRISQNLSALLQEHVPGTIRHAQKALKEVQEGRLEDAVGEVMAIRESCRSRRKG